MDLDNAERRVGCWARKAGIHLAERETHVERWKRNIVQSHTGDGFATLDNSKGLRLDDLGFVKLHTRRVERLGCHIWVGLLKNMLLSSPSLTDLRFGDCPINVLYPLGNLPGVWMLSRSHQESAKTCEDAMLDRFSFLRWSFRGSDQGNLSSQNRWTTAATR